MMLTLEYRHVDVFSRRAFQGNGLVVVLDDIGLPADLMQALTREMRQFETVFLTAVDLAARSATLRIFTEDEELDFAGHPVLGAAAVLHGMLGTRSAAQQWAMLLAGRTIAVRTAPGDSWIDAEMDQGVPRFGPIIERAQAVTYADALGLTEDQLHPELPVQVVSTGLDYLIVPLSAGLEQARIRVPDFEALLERVGAKFVYVLDPLRPEGRTWDNAGRVEDVATGSAAGPAAAYLMRHRVVPEDQPIVLHQGQHVGRPSSIRVTPAPEGRLWVGGPVAPVAAGYFEATIA
jgi:trans-2,3-dihydro-3-hydroxyanthranilate isomerase